MQKKQQITLIYISKVVFFKEFYQYVHVLFNALLLLYSLVQNVCGSARMFLCLSDTVDESDTSATTTTYDHVVTREPFSSRGWHNALVQYIPALNRKPAALPVFPFFFILLTVKKLKISPSCFLKTELKFISTFSC